MKKLFLLFGSFTVLSFLLLWVGLDTARAFNTTHDADTVDVTATIEKIHEIVDLNTYGPGSGSIVGPVVSTEILLKGNDYLVTISGTVSYWFPHTWSAICRGTPEESPQIPSPDIQNGKVSSDPAYTFASPTVWSECQNFEHPLPSDKIEISLDNGVTWSKLTPINQVYNSSHVYRYRIQGGGHKIQFRLKDFPTNDNYGVFRINIEGPYLAPTCQNAFSDEFDSSLDPDWTYLDPRNDTTQNLIDRPGFLRISAPTGNDLWPLTNYDAPRLIQRVTGDFAIETHIEFTPTTDYQGAGLLIWQDDNNFLRLERGYGGVNARGVSGIRFDKEENGLYDAVTPTSQRPTSVTNFELRVQRNENRFMAWWREPGKAWEYVGGTDIEFKAEIMVGLVLIAQYGVPQTTANYDYFRIACPSTLAPPIRLQARAGLNSVLLSWEPSASFGIVGYHVYRQAAGETTFTRITSTPVPGLTYRDFIPVNPATSYAYYVTAIDSLNQESDPSNTATVTPGKLTFIIPTVYAARGMTATVPTNLENGDGLCISAMNVGIQYNPQIATATKVAPTSLTQGYTFSANFTQPNQAQIASIGNCQELKGPGSLWELDFSVQPTAAASTTLSFVQGLTGTVLYDKDNLTTPLLLNLINGQLIVSANGSYKRGDLNGDAVVNASDVMLALQIATGAVLPKPAQLSAGDVNGDQVINAGDAAMILYFIANQVWPSSVTTQVYAAETSDEVIQIQPITVAGDVGQEVEVPLQINKGDQVAGATIILRYGKGLSYKNVQLDSVLTAKGYVLTINPIGANELRLSLVGPMPMSGSDQTLGKVRFSLDKDATNGQTQVAVVGAWLSDQAGRDFSLSALQQTVVGGQGMVRINERVHLPLIRR